MGFVIDFCFPRGTGLLRRSSYHTFTVDASQICTIIRICRYIVGPSKLITQVAGAWNLCDNVMTDHAYGNVTMQV